MMEKGEPIPDQLLELMESWIEMRESCAEELKKLAGELESLREKCCVSECVGSTTSVIGALTLIGGGVATIFTAGLAAPLLGVGAAVSGAGVAVSVVTKITEHFSSSSTLKKAQDIEKDSNETAGNIQKLFEQLKEEVKRENPHTDPEELDRLVMGKLLGAMARQGSAHWQTHFFNRACNVFYRAGPGNMTVALMARFIGTQLLVELGGILAFFVLELTGKEAKLLFGIGAVKLIRQMTAAGLKSALKGGAAVVGGAVGLAFSLPEAIINWTDLIKNNHVTMASKSLRDTADDILKMCETLREQFRSARKLLEELADVKRCIEKTNRTPEEKNKVLQFVTDVCQDDTVKRWMMETLVEYRQHSESESSESLHEAFFQLMNVGVFLQQELDEKKESDSEDSEVWKDVDIIFVAHGGIDEPMMPASTLLPMSAITDVLLYSPWNCLIDANVAYSIAIGSIQPEDRSFTCAGDDCPVPADRHHPDFLPDDWNYMRAAGGLIPTIRVRTLTPDDGAWKHFLILESHHGPPGRNRIVIPFLLPGGFSLSVPFFFITLALSVALFFSKYRAGVHLAACLGGMNAGTRLSPAELQRQYSYTINNTKMTCPEETFVYRRPDLHGAFRAMFG